MEQSTYDFLAYVAQKAQYKVVSYGEYLVNLREFDAVVDSGVIYAADEEA